MNDMTREEMRDRLGNLDKIRDILVGSQMRDYENRFSQIESELSLLHQDMSDRIDTVKNSLRQEIQLATENLEKQLKSLATNTREELADRRQQIDRIDQKLGSHVETLDGAIEQKTSLLRNQFAETRDKFQGDLRALRSQVFEELESRFSMLRDDKLAKDDMAAVLFELGMRLRGDEFVPALRAAIDTEVSAEIMSD